MTIHAELGRSKAGEERVWVFLPLRGGQRLTETAGALMWNYFWVAVGGALGTLARFWFSGVVARHIGETFPWGTLLVNVSGSLVIGFVATYFGPESRFLAPPEVRQFVMIGILGGYTTFSSFSLQTLNLVRDGNWLAASGNVLGSVGLCLVAVWLGHLAALGAISIKGQ